MLKERLRAKVKTKGRKKPDFEINQKWNIGKKTKRPSVKTTTIDRSGDKTKVIDEVKEQNEDGKWEVVHRHLKK
jgi:hypothetical protein